MSRRNSPWTIIIVVVLCLALVGLSISLNIVSTEGWDGLWNRKKGFIKDAQPATGPVINEAEKQIKDRAGGK